MDGVLRGTWPKSKRPSTMAAGGVPRARAMLSGQGDRSPRARTSPSRRSPVGGPPGNASRVAGPAYRAWRSVGPLTELRYEVPRPPDLRRCGERGVGGAAAGQLPDLTGG